MLWTPNPKTVDPVPLCPRCGKPRHRFQLPGHSADTRRFMPGWLHGVCCCEDPCEAGAIMLTLSGIDSAVCPCKTVASKDFEIDPISVDGSYNIGLFSISSGICVFRETQLMEGGFTKKRYNSTDASCSGSLFSSASSGGLEVIVSYRQSDQSVGQVIVRQAIGTSFPGTGDVFEYPTGSPTYGVYFLGDSIPNQLLCSDTGYIVSENGTAVLTA